MLDVQRRILVFNVFITPIFSFVQQFYTMPSSVLREYRSIMHRMISPFNGTAWPYSQLCAPTACVGFRQPLRDPWAHGTSLLLKGYDFSEIRSEADLPWNLDGSFRAGDKVTSNWDSPVFSDHTNLQVMEFLGPSFMDWDGYSELPPLKKADIKKIVIDKLIVSYGTLNSLSYTRNFGLDHSSHLRNRLLKAGVTGACYVTDHFANLPKKVPPFLISHYIKVLCGALNSDGGRRRKFDPDASAHHAKGIDNPFPCYLCDRGSVDLPGDCSKHLFSACDRVKSAWVNLINKSLNKRDLVWASSFIGRNAPFYIIDYPIADPMLGYSRLALIMAFCWSIHKTINQIRSGRDPSNADLRVATLTISLDKLWSKPKPNSKSS
jgi:hypothetical protein